MATLTFLGHIFLFTWILHHFVVIVAHDQQDSAAMEDEDTRKLDITMRKGHPNSDDAYLCSTYNTTDLIEDINYIVGFGVVGNSDSAHHILLCSCDGDAADMSDKPWDCHYEICAKSTKRYILFGSARNAPPTKVPKDIGFPVGRMTKSKTLVLQIHYKSKFNDDQIGDESGVQISLTPKRQRYFADVSNMGAYNFEIPPNMTHTHIDASCVYRGTKSVFPFAFRPHTHGLGSVVTGYIVNGTGTSTWYQFAKGNPQWPQAFYPVNGNYVLHPGDAIVARCTYDSTGRNQTTKNGFTNNEEMCILYVMYYTTSETETMDRCIGNNVPLIMSHIPADSDTPLPPNPELERMAGGDGSHHHHHQLSDMDFHGSVNITKPSHAQPKHSDSPREENTVIVLLIGAFLVIAAVVMLVFTFSRSHRTGKMPCGVRKPNVISLQSLLGNSHKGFQPLTSDEFDQEIDSMRDFNNKYLTSKSKK